MFDPCDPWRKLLSHLSEGEVTPTEYALLENHLKRCARCRLALDADVALRIISAIPTERMGVLEAKNFDERVVAAFNLAKRESPVESLRYWVREREALAKAQGREFEFKMLMAGGACVASAFVLILLYLFVHSSQQPSNSIAEGMQRPSAHNTPSKQKTIQESSVNGGVRLFAVPSNKQHSRSREF